MKPLLSALALAALAAGCATPPPPTSQRVVAHSAAADAGGALVIVDVCVNYSPLVTTDYFVVSNARQGAAAMEAVARQFLDAADLRSRTVLIPFVCGALHGATNTPKRIADQVDGDVTERPQPLWVAPELAADTDYVSALQTLSTHVFRRSVAAYDKDKPLPEGIDTAAEDERARKAAVLAAQRSGRSSLVYIGVTGHSNSSGKTAAAGIAIVIGSVATTLAIGPVFTAAGASYHVVFVPGGPVDKRQMAAGIYDLKQGKLVASRVVGAPGDPMKPEVLAERNGLNLLLREMLLTPAP